MRDPEDESGRPKLQVRTALLDSDLRTSGASRLIRAFLMPRIAFGRGLTRHVERALRDGARAAELLEEVAMDVASRLRLEPGC